MEEEGVNGCVSIMAIWQTSRSEGRAEGLPRPPHRLATCAPPNPRDQPRAPRREQGARRPDQPEPDAQHSPCSHSAASSRSPRPCMVGGAGGVRIRTHGSGGLGRRCSVLRLALVLPSPLRLLPSRPALPQRPAPCPRPISPSGPGRAGPGHLRARSRPHPASPVSFWSPGAPGQCPVSSVQHTVLSTWTELSRAGGQTNLGHSCNCIPHAGEETGWGCPGGPAGGGGGSGGPAACEACASSSSPAPRLLRPHWGDWARGAHRWGRWPGAGQPPGSGSRPCSVERADVEAQWTALGCGRYGPKSAAACPLLPPAPSFCPPCPALQAGTTPLWPGDPGFLQLSWPVAPQPHSERAPGKAGHQSVSRPQVKGCGALSGSRPEVKVQRTMISPKVNSRKRKTRQEGFAHTLGYLGRG
nr:uncharacterized protein LOC115839874 [Globicephala melas]